MGVYRVYYEHISVLENIIGEEGGGNFGPPKKLAYSRLCLIWIFVFVVQRVRGKRRLHVGEQQRLCDVTEWQRRRGNPKQTQQGASQPKAIESKSQIPQATGGDRRRVQ